MLFAPIPPMLASMRPEPWNEPAWVFQPKFDGFRLQLHVAGDRMEAYTRSGRRITAQFPELLTARAAISADSVILDGEIVCIREGRPRFDDLAVRGHLTHPLKIQVAQTTHPATFVAFDVLHLNGHDLMARPLVERLAQLEAIIQASPTLMPSLTIPETGVALFETTKEWGWEGIVAKRATSTYDPGRRSQSWQKLKHWQRLDVVILGYRRQPHFALIVGAHFPTRRNKPIATLEFGFTQADKTAFLAIAPQLHTMRENDTQWVEPKLCCEVQYLERSARHQLRIATFKRFLPNKDPATCLWSA